MDDHRSGFTPKAWDELGKKQLEAAAGMQKELFDTVEGMNRAWLDHARSEMTLASDLFGRLLAARSFPDAATAYQECMDRQMEMIAEDGRRLFTEGEKLIRSGARLFSNGSPGVSS
jgi:hypothetical protein